MSQSSSLKRAKVELLFLNDIPSNPGFIHATILLEIATKKPKTVLPQKSLVSLIPSPYTELPYINNSHQKPPHFHQIFRLVSSVEAGK